MNKRTAICQYLKQYHTGMGNAVYSRELERLFSIEGRNLRRMISALRKEGYPICSGDMGYYFAESQKEINSTVGRLNDLMTSVSNARTGLLYSCLLDPVMSIEITVNLNRGDS